VDINFNPRRYHIDSEILVTTILTDLHEELHLAFYNRFLILISLDDKSLGPMSTMTSQKEGHPSGELGMMEADSTGGPEIYL